MTLRKLLKGCGGCLGIIILLVVVGAVCRYPVTWAWQKWVVPFGAGFEKPVLISKEEARQTQCIDGRTTYVWNDVTYQCSDNQVAPAGATTQPEGSTGTYYGGSPSCITDGDAQSQLGVDVQRLTTEPCSWVWRGSTVTPKILPGWMLTVDLADRSIVKLFDGDQPNEGSVGAYAFTARMKAGFPSTDAVWNNCQLLAKEVENGIKAVPSFQVVPGNFTCSGATNLAPMGGQTPATTCPEFGGVPTTPMQDGGCKLEWDAQRGVVTGTLPSGWTILCDLQGPNPDGTWTCGSASLYPPAP